MKEVHRGSTLNLFWFPTDEVRQEPPWMIMFADDAVICSESREQVEEAELKMLILSLGVKRTDRMRNEHIRGTTQAEARLRWFGWFGQMQKRNNEDIGGRMFRKELPITD